MAILDPSIREARTFAHRRMLGNDAAAPPDLLPLPAGPLPGPLLPTDPLPGFFVPLAFDPSTKPLSTFERGLDELERGAKRKVRIAVYGASGTQSDLWTGYVRAYLQARFGDGGEGIVPSARPTTWFRHSELRVESSRHWKRINGYLHVRSGAAGPGYLGVMGQAMRAHTKGAWASVRPERSHAGQTTFITLHVLRTKSGGSFRVAIDGAEKGLVRTRLAEGDPHPRAEVLRYEAKSERPVFRVELLGDGEVQLLGTAFEREAPGVVLDTLGVHGAKASGHRVFDDEVFRAGLRERAPDLFVLAYGTNEAAEDDEPASAYEADLGFVLERLKGTVPSASCVVFGPTDFPRIEAGEVKPRPRVAALQAITVRVAHRFGCAFWDPVAFAGGEGSKAVWVALGLAKDDYLHLSRAGYARFGLGFADALMEAYDRSHAPL